MTLRSQTLDLLCKLLRSGDEADRCYTTRALGVLRDTTTVELLIERLQSEESRPQRRRRAAHTLAKSATSEAATALGRALREIEPEIRAEAVFSLAALNADLDDEEMGIRVIAAKDLAQVLKPLNEETFTLIAVEEMVSSVTIEARLIGRALRQFDSNLGNQALLAQLKDADDSVKPGVFIEMIEELLSPDQKRPEQAA